MNPFLPSLFLALVSTTQVAYALETGGVVGYVVDEQGLPIPGAELRLSGVDLGGEKVIVANPDGEFTLDGLSPGTYQLAVYFKGALVAKAEVRVALNTTTKVPIEARLGTVSEEIEIVGFKPVVDTSSSAISTELSAKEIQEIPVGRSYQDVVQTLAGVSGRIDTSKVAAATATPASAAKASTATTTRWTACPPVIRRPRPSARTSTSTPSRSAGLHRRRPRRVRPVHGDDGQRRHQGRRRRAPRQRGGVLRPARLLREEVRDLQPRRRPRTVPTFGSRGSGPRS
jgi:hypothetical protein